MLPLRALIRRNRRLALALLVLGFAIRALVPAGYMLASHDGARLAVTICTGSSAGFQQIEMAIPGKPAEQGDGQDAAGNGGHCAFAGLGSLAIGGADALLLALAFAVILVLGLAPARRLPFAALAHLRPPLRGPPATA